MLNRQVEKEQLLLSLLMMVKILQNKAHLGITLTFICFTADSTVNVKPKRSNKKLFTNIAEQQKNLQDDVRYRS